MADPAAPIVVDVIVDQDVAVTVADPAAVEVVAVPGDTIPVVVIPGKDGDPGGGFDGTAWWYGQGPPVTGNVIGAKAGDFYVDTLTGNLYELQVG